MAAEQARVEAMKMEAESRTPGHRDEWVRRIDEIATRIERVAIETDNEPAS